MNEINKDKILPPGWRNMPRPEDYGSIQEWGAGSLKWISDYDIGELYLDGKFMSEEDHSMLLRLFHYASTFPEDEVVVYG